MRHGKLDPEESVLDWGKEDYDHLIKETEDEKKENDK